MIKSAYSIFGLLIMLLGACTSNTDGSEKPLPILGFPEVVDGDTLWHTISDFEFVDQDSNLVNNASYGDKIYVTDFFFTTCPSICPIVTRQMLILYDEFENEERVKFLSHTLDVAYDSVAVLKAYADDIHIDANRWRLVTGDETKIYDMANEYFIAAEKDPDAPGGFNHSGKLILVDTDRHVRAFCEGTDPESVQGFVKDIRKLLDEMD